MPQPPSEPPPPEPPEEPKKEPAPSDRSAAGKAGAASEAASLDATIRAAARGEEAAWRRLVKAYSRRVYGLLWRQCGDGELAEELTQATFVKVASALGGEGSERSGGNAESGSGGGSGGSESSSGGSSGGSPGGSESGSGGGSGGGGRYVEQGHFESWLFRIALNSLRDEMRRRGRQAKVVDMSPAALSSSSTTGSAWGAAQEAIARRSAGHDDPAAVASRRETVEQVRAAVAQLSDPEQRVLHLRHTAGLSFAQIAETLHEPIGTVLARNHRALAKLRRKLNPDDRQE